VWLSRAEVLVYDGKQCVTRCRLVGGSATNDDLLASKVVALDLDAKLIASIEPECRLFTHVGHSLARQGCLTTASVGAWVMLVAQRPAARECDRYPGLALCA